jgi:hypothetical protein
MALVSQRVRESYYTPSGQLPPSWERCRVLCLSRKARSGLYVESVVEAEASSRRVGSVVSWFVVSTAGSRRGSRAGSCWLAAPRES